MKIGVFHPGTQHSWQTAKAFLSKERLAWYVTSVFYREDRFPYTLIRYLPDRLKNRLKNELLKRYYKPLDCDLTHEGAVLEWFKTLLIRFKFKRLSKFVHVIAVKQFSKKVIKKINEDRVDAVWGFDACCLEVFKYAKSKGVVCILDHTTIHPVTQNEIINSIGGAHISLLTDLWIERVCEECILADIILVGSEFALVTLTENGVPREKIKVLPYPYDEELFFKSQTVKASKPIRFIFSGALKVTKGVRLLLEAFATIPAEVATLTLLGHDLGEIVLSEYKNISNINFLEGVPRARVPELLAEYDCLVLPTYFDGGGIVMYEAASCGLAVIQSRFCGDGVRNNNGLIVQEQTPNAYRSAILSLVNDSEKLDEFKINSLNCASDRSFSSYAFSVNSLLEKLYV